MRNPPRISASQRSLTAALVLGCALGAAAACGPARIGEPGDGNSGAFGGSSGSAGAAGSGAGTSLIQDRSLCKPGTLDVGPSPIRRISRVEYNNMVRDLLSDHSRPADKFVAEDKVLAFNSSSVTPVSELSSEQYFTSAEGIAERIDVQALSGCTAPLDDACAQSYLERFAKRAFRGVLVPEDRDRMLGLYASTKAEFDAETALRMAVRSVLVSPRFLYVIEVGEPDPGPVVRLTQHEVASRLALYLWRSVPDEELLAVADSAALSTREEVGEQARRMLADPRAQSTLEDFALQWMALENVAGLTKSSQKYPDFDAALASDLRTETLTFFREFVYAKATLPMLFTAKFSYLNSTLASFYGVQGGGGDSFAPADLDPAQRSGILTHAAVLAAQAHPTKAAPVLRGKLVRERVFCQTLPAPPNNVNMNVPDPEPGRMTTSDVYREHALNPDCSYCHKKMDPIGFGFSHYDAVGKYVNEDNGVAVDASGEVLEAAKELDGPFVGAVELSERIAGSDHVKACFSIQNFRYALGRAEVVADACSLQAAYDAFATNDFTLIELMVALTSSDSFRHRRKAEPGGACQ